MQAYPLPAQSGFQWFKNALNLFKKAPLPLILLGFVFQYTTYLSMLFGPFTLIVLHMITSLFIAVYYHAIHLVEQSQSAPLAQAFKAWRLQTKTVPNLLLMGLLLGIVCSLLAVLCNPFANIDFQYYAALLEKQATTFAEQEQLAAQILSQIDSAKLLLFFVLLHILYLLLCYAPILIYKHALPFHKAIFFSIVAFTRNLLPFILLVVCLLVFGVLLSLVITFCAKVISSPLLLLMLVQLLGLCFFAVLLCALYSSYKGIFHA
ncbi:BPSS1780 family membrane protein [Brackiella oedipodis]|uniref:BPSS1780 family membrane protein n=1 Tax=Brackiella oedipodis TaxID=124225 RepID=UPI00048BBFA1|nr:BPSS1780 family membrane protein [Brackiella oedipodis]